jgi:hypothetical protein
MRGPAEMGTTADARFAIKNAIKTRTDRQARMF